MDPEEDRVIIILGEIHSDEIDRGVTTKKIAKIISDNGGIFSDVVLFTEAVGAKNYNTPLGIKAAIPIKNKDASIIQGLFLCFEYFIPMVKNGNKPFPGSFGRTPSNSIHTILTRFAGITTISEADLLRDPSGTFRAIIGILHDMCTRLKGKNAQIILDNFRSITPGPVKGTICYEAALCLVNDEIIENIHEQHYQHPPDVAFIIVVGEDHRREITQQLLTSGRKYIVKSIASGERVTPLSVNELPIDGGKKQTRYRKKRMKRNGKRSRKFNKK